MKRTYDYYLNRWLEGVNMQTQVDYADPKSVRKYNKGLDPRIGWEWWLKQPWAQEENCTDFAV